MATQAAPAALAKASTALERGRGAEAAQVLAPLLRSGTLNRQDELVVRAALAEAYLLQDDLTQAAATLGRTPDTLREAHRRPALHVVAAARPPPSRAAINRAPSPIARVRSNARSWPTTHGPSDSHITSWLSTAALATPASCANT